MGRDRPELIEGIEITDAMRAVGVQVIYSLQGETVYSLSRGSVEDLAVEVFSAMAQAGGLRLRKGRPHASR